MRAETVQLGDLTVDGTLKNGRLTFTTLKGNLFDRKQTYAEFQGELTLDTTTDIPTLSGKSSIHNLNSGHLLRGIYRTTVSLLVWQTWRRNFPVRAVPSLPC